MISLGLYSAERKQGALGMSSNMAAFSFRRDVEWKGTEGFSKSVTDSALEIKDREEVERNSCQRA